MATNSGLRQRRSDDTAVDSDPTTNLSSTVTQDVESNAHPSGKSQKGRLQQLIRGIGFVVFFVGCGIAINITQFLGAPLYFINREIYYAYMAKTKESFGVVATVGTKIWGPTTIRISGDASVADQIKRTPDGRVQFSFPERLILIANHQIYTDWLYLWWVGYANTPSMHGHVYILLKESLKYLPIIGPGMMFYGFIFMSRKMAVDQPRMAHRLQRLKQSHTAPDGQRYLDPMWLLLFPEGTNASFNGRNKSAAWAKKSGQKDPAHVLLPRSTGMFFILQQLRGSVEYLYDCTVAYEGIPRGEFGQDYFTLSSTYFKGQPPKSVNFYWRRFRISDIPLDDSEKYDLWLRERWYEKDALMEQYYSTGRFPPLPPPPPPPSARTAATGVAAANHTRTPSVEKSSRAPSDGFVETEVRPKHWWEILQVFVVIGVFGLMGNIIATLWGRLKHAVA